MTTATEILDSFLYVRYEIDIEDTLELSRSIVELIDGGHEMESIQLDNLKQFLMIIPDDIFSDAWVGISDLATRNVIIYKAKTKWLVDNKFQKRVNLI